MALISRGLPAMNFIRADSNVELGASGYYKYQLFGQDLYLTTTHVSILIVCVTLIIFAIIANRVVKKADPYKAPGVFLNILELSVQSLDNLVVSNMGKKHGPKFANYIGTLAIIIGVILYCLLTKKWEYIDIKKINHKGLFLFHSVLDLGANLSSRFSLVNGQVSTVSVITSSSIVITILASRFILKEKISLKKYLMILGIFVCMLILALTK